MTNAERKQMILEMVSRNKSVQITDLVKQFDVSVMTIRRDLAELEDKKYIKRVYGGAVLNEEELNKQIQIRSQMKYQDIVDKSKDEVYNYDEAQQKETLEKLK